MSLILPGQERGPAGRDLHDAVVPASVNPRITLMSVSEEVTLKAG
jgi:hypothetical protein